MVMWWWLRGPKDAGDAVAMNKKTGKTKEEVGVREDEVYGESVVSTPDRKSRKKI